MGLGEDLRYIERRGTNVSITRTGYWPFGESWQWIPIKGRTTLVSTADPPSVSQCSALQAPHLNESKAAQVIAWYELSKSKTEWTDDEANRVQDLIGQLLAVALNNHSAAREALLQPRAQIPSDGYLGFVWQAAREDLLDFEKLPACAGPKAEPHNR